MDLSTLTRSARGGTVAARNRVLITALRTLRGPVSEVYGFDRGTPVDRPHIERFLQAHAGDVRGRVLEVKEATYARRLGGARVTSVDVVDVDVANDRATLVGDLDDPGLLEAGAYDCVVLTQTLQFLDPAKALPNLYTALRPGGTLLLTVAALCRFETPDTDKWRLPPAGLSALLAEHLPPDAEITVAGHGNAVAAAAFLLGLAVEEVGAGVGGADDWRFPLVTTARIGKPGGPGA